MRNVSTTTDLTVEKLERTLRDWQTWICTRGLIVFGIPSQAGCGAELRLPGGTLLDNPDCPRCGRPMMNKGAGV